MTLANLSVGPGALQAISTVRARVVVPSQASALSLSCAASRPSLLLDTSNGGRVWTVTRLSVGAGPVVATGFAGRGGWLVSGAAFPGCPATLDATVDVGSRWSVLGSVPTVGEGAPSTPGYDIDALSPDDAWLWLTRFGDALGEPEALVLETGLLKTVDHGAHMDQVLAAAIGSRHMACRSTVARGPWTCRDPVPPRSTCRRLDAGRNRLRPRRAHDGPTRALAHDRRRTTLGRGELTAPTEVRPQ